MKKLLILLFSLGCVSGYAQINTFGGVGLRVNDTTTYQTNAAAYHTAGYYDIYFNNQATNDHWDIWNGSSYDHIFAFNAGGGAGVSGLTTNRVPYAASSTSLADNANFIVRRSSAIQGNNGFGIMGQVVIGGTYNAANHRNVDYASSGKHSYGLEIVNDETTFVTDSLSSGQLALTGYGGSVAGVTSLHVKAARGSAVSPTKLISGDRMGGMGFRGYTDAGEFSTSAAAILVYTEQDFVSQSTLGTQMQFEVTTNSVPGRIIAQTIDNTGAVGFLNSIAAGTSITAGTNITSTAGSIIAAVDADINGVVDIDGTSGSAALTIGTTTNNLGNTKAYGIFDAQTNDGLSIGSESGNNLRGSNNDRIGRIKFSQYAANSTTYFAGLQGQGTSSLNLLQYGIAASPTNSATEHRFYTAANITTVVGTEQWRIAQAGGLSNTAANATAGLNLKASTTAASSGQIKLVEGTALTTPENGNINYVSDNLQFTETTTVYTLAKTLTATATLDFPSVASLGVQTLTITVTGAADGDIALRSVPNASMTAGLVFTAWVSASNTVSIQCYNSTLGAIDPASATFRASIIKY